MSLPTHRVGVSVLADERELITRAGSTRALPRCAFVGHPACASVGLRRGANVARGIAKCELPAVEAGIARFAYPFQHDACFRRAVALCIEHAIGRDGTGGSRRAELLASIGIDPAPEARGDAARVQLRRPLGREISPPFVHVRPTWAVPIFANNGESANTVRVVSSSIDASHMPLARGSTLNIIGARFSRGLRAA